MAGGEPKATRSFSSSPAIRPNSTSSPARRALKIGRELKLINENRFEFCWIVDFPMYEWNEEEKKIDFSHNPFLMPQGGLAALEAAKKQEEELLGPQGLPVRHRLQRRGALLWRHPQPPARDHVQGLCHRRLRPRGAGGQVRRHAEGAPPTAPPRTAASRRASTASSCSLAGASNLRDVIMFPMNQQAQDLLMGAPSEVTPKQLRELHIRLAERK